MDTGDNHLWGILSNAEWDFLKWVFRHIAWATVISVPSAFIQEVRSGALDWWVLGTVFFASLFILYMTSEGPRSMTTPVAVSSPAPLSVVPSPNTPDSDLQQAQGGPYQYRNEMNIADTIRFVRQLSELFKQRTSLTFVITAPPSSKLFESDFRAFIVAACQLAGNKCVIENTPDPAIDIDANIPVPEYPGIVIHHVPVSPSDGMSTSFMWAMGGFIARKSSRVPEGIARLNTSHNPDFYWFELGSGCPWASASVCGVSEE
jgi:hypothetical protein